MQKQPWYLRTDDSRQDDRTAIFIIFCEDQNDEPDYFRGFQTEDIKINVIENQKQGRLNLIKTLAYCSKNDFVEFKDNAYRRKEGITDNIWCVYDRDLENNDIAKVEHHDDVDFTAAIQTAEHAGLNVAWSNDAFELWVLLHFEDVPTKLKLHREYIYERLTSIFKNLPAQADELVAITGKKGFYYKTHLKRQKTFTPYVLPFLKDKDRRDAAITRARKIQTKFNANTPFHDRNPCTMVHTLVEELLKYSEA